MLALGDRRPVANGLIVSLTSFPLRIGSVHFVIRSLLNQSLRPQKIVLYLSSEEFPGRRLPRKVAALAGERFEIRFVDENLRPHNKLIFALSDFPKATIVTCDDDRIYPDYWLACLWAAAKAKAGMIVYIRGRRIIVSSNGSFAPYLGWPFEASLEPTYWTLPLGGWGILYPPGCFHTTMGDRKLIRELALLQDDLWNKAINLLRDVPCCRIGVDHKEILQLHIDNNVALSTYNRRRGGNDAAIERVFGHFGITPEVIAAKETKLRAGCS